MKTAVTSPTSQGPWDGAPQLRAALGAPGSDPGQRLRRDAAPGRWSSFNGGSGENVGKMWGKCGENVGKMWGKCGENVGKRVRNWWKNMENVGKTRKNDGNMLRNSWKIPRHWWWTCVLFGVFWWKHWGRVDTVDDFRWNKRWKLMICWEKQWNTLEKLRFNKR